jgi:hypothetical protein
MGSRLEQVREAKEPIVETPLASFLSYPKTKTYSFTPSQEESRVVSTTSPAKNGCHVNKSQIVSLALCGVSTML